MLLRAGHRYRNSYFLLPLLAAMLSLYAGSVCAQFKSSPTLSDNMSPSVRKQTPTFIFGDAITSRTELEVDIEGRAEIRKTDTVIRAKRIEYNQVSDVAKITGDVFVNQGGNRFWGPDLQISVTDFTGFFKEPSYQFYKTGGQGSAKQIEFVSQRMAIAKLANYSTCKRPEANDGKPWKPDWILNADQIDFNMEEDIATATGMTLRFKDVPILAIPGFSFPMSGSRKSGLLAPSFATDNQSGFILTQPIYWNIAPNRDATFYPTTIAKRGFNYGGEFRYLEANSVGTFKADYLPNDKLLNSQNRWAYAVDQRQLFRAPMKGASDINTSLRLARVSDELYWRDMPNSTSSLTQRLLNNELNSVATLDGWATQLRFQRWQTLQTSTSTITPPFDRNQLFTRRAFNLPNGLNFQVEADITEFRSQPLLTLQPNGTRAYALGQMSRPFIQPSGYITPKVQFHATTYYTDNAAAGVDTSSQRTLPIFSLDSGLFFERITALFNRSFIQTLEPRVFYVRTPFRDQSGLPNYDSGTKDFNLSTIYTENTFVGNDRIADMHMLTLGLSTKFLNESNGAQAFSAGIAQRFSYIDQQVTLPNTIAPTSRLSDYLLNASARLQPTWQVDGTVQVGSNSGTAERTTLSTRYAPSNYRSLGAAYRMQKGISEQVDVNWQWPLGDLFQRADEITGSNSAGRGLGANRWYSVGRLNYSAIDRRLVNAIVGFEYDADCWIGRVVLEKTQLDASTTNQRLMFQIEFSGFSRFGTSPLASLRGNIPRYQNLREQITTPSRFSQYD